MGLETATVIAIVGATAAVGGGVYAGIAANNEADHQARVARAEAENRAAAARRQYERLRRQQKVAFLNSGVSLEGSPLLVLEATRQEGNQAANDFIAQGNSAAKDLNRQGRNALIGGIVSGISSGASIGAKGASAGGGSNTGGGGSNAQTADISSGVE